MNYQITVGDPMGLRSNIILTNPIKKAIEINQFSHVIVKVHFFSMDYSMDLYSHEIDQISIYEKLGDEECIILDSHPFLTWGKNYYTEPTEFSYQVAKLHREARKSRKALCP